MKITITIPKEAVDAVKSMAREVSGKKPSKEQLIEFFTQDIEGLYSDSFGEGIEDAVESYFGVLKDPEECWAD
jgi:hypothetical protein